MTPYSKVRAWKLSNPEKVRAQKARYRAKYPDMVAFESAIRQAKETAEKHGVPTIPYTPRQVMDTFGPKARWLCFLCGQKGADSLDHLVPMATGGPNALFNLITAHHGCNARKGSRPAVDFLRHHVMSPGAVVSAEVWAETLSALARVRAAE